MKKIIIFFCLTILQCCQHVPVLAQPSDLVIDSLETAQTLRLYEFDATPSQLFCPGYGLIHTGHNRTLTARIILANMGPGTAHMGVGNVTPGVHFEPCRGYNYYKNFCRFTTLDKCLDTITTSTKAMYDVASGQRYLSPLDFTRWAWITQYGVPDTAYLNHTLDSGMTTDIAPILYAGWRDVYGAAQFGNWLPLDSDWDKLIIGEGYYFSIAINPYFLDEGANIYPNSTGNIPFVFNGNSITVGAFNSPTPSPPFNPTVDKKTREISWIGAGDACRYKVRTMICSPNGTEQAEASWSPQYTNGTTFIDQYAVARSNQVPGGMSFRFYVSSISGSSESAPGHTEKAIKFN